MRIFKPEKLERIMSDLDLSDRSLGKQAGIDPTLIGRYKSGEAAPGINKIAAIADVLKQPIDYFCDNSVAYSPRSNSGPAFGESDATA